MRTLLLVVLTSLLATPSLAGECPMLMRQIDEDIVSYDLEIDVDLSEVKQHRTAGEIAHLAGDHSTALYELQQALTLMGVRS